DRLYDTVDGHHLSAPNDLVFEATGNFWFTDTGKTHARHTDLGGVYYAAPDGSAIREAIYGLLGPNGVGLSPAGDRLYVADTPTGRLWTWDLVDGKLPSSDPRRHGGSVLAGLPGALVFDSLALDSEGRVIAALPGGGALAVIDPDGDLRLIGMPDRMPTNVCFGGPDNRTAYVTLAAQGLLATFPWP